MGEEPSAWEALGHVLMIGVTGTLIGATVLLPLLGAGIWTTSWLRRRIRR